MERINRKKKGKGTNEGRKERRKKTMKGKKV